MGAAHTPGPWELKQFGGPQISGPKGYAICTMWGALSVSELSGQDTANARLIAAAPELLEALEAIVANVGRKGHDGYYDGVVHSQEVDQARSAIAKALGETA